MKVYTVSTGMDHEGDAAFAAFTRKEDAERLIELLKENEKRFGEQLYGDYLTVSALDLFTSLDEYMLPENVGRLYDPYETYEVESDGFEWTLNS